MWVAWVESEEGAPTAAWAVGAAVSEARAAAEALAMAVAAEGTAARAVMAATAAWPAETAVAMRCGACRSSCAR